MKKISIFPLAALLFLLTETASGQTPVYPSSAYHEVTIGSGWSQPLGLQFSPDGLLLFVWEKAGRVYVCKRNPTTGVYAKQATAVLDISSEVGNWGDHGLNGFSIDPNFATNGFIYCLYVVGRNALLGDASGDVNKVTIGRLSRFTTTTAANGTITTNLATKKILIGETKSTGFPILYDSHGMGTVAFAADGTLLVSAGDGASYNNFDDGPHGDSFFPDALSLGIIRPAENVGAYRSQMINCLSGKLLRIDPVTGDGIPSNPYYDAANPHSVKSRVWALGLRNPFRFSFKPGTGSGNPATGDIGEIYLGDVGFDTREELDIITAPGMNLGWPVYEGLTINTNGYNTHDAVNMDEPNPLFGQNGCTQQYFTFQQLIKQATADGVTAIYNPCNPIQQIGNSANSRQYVHRPPSIDWTHGVLISRVPKFSGNNLVTQDVGTPASGVTGNIFGGNCSIGGCWYTGTLYPANFRNTYMQVDYGASWIRTFSINFTDVVQQVQEFATNMGSIVGLIQNPLDGTLVYVNVASSVVKAITYGGNQLPVVVMSSDKKFGPGPLQVVFSSVGSSDDGGIANATYTWDFNDGTAVSHLANPTHTFNVLAAAGPTQYNVKLSIKDNQNAVSEQTMVISANNTPPVVHITSPVNNSLYTIGGNATLTLAATVTDAEHSNAQLSYQWQTTLRHNTHEHPGPLDLNKTTTAVINKIGCNGETYYWDTKLTVTDAAGLATTDFVDIFPDCNGTPSSGIINGAVTLDGRPAPPNDQWKVPIALNLYAPGTTTPVYSLSPTSDENGLFVINSGIVPGTYTVSIKTPNSLTKVLTGQPIAAGANSMDFGRLKLGDLDGENTITLQDLGILLSSYNKALGDAGYTAAADLNGDNLVNILDLGILLSNYNTAGDVL